jgi:hypothetical protein
MPKFGWKITLAAALAVVFNLGASPSARADHLRVTVSGGSTTRMHAAAAGATSFTVPTSRLVAHFPELTGRGGGGAVIGALHSHAGRVRAPVAAARGVDALRALRDGPEGLRRALIVGGGHHGARAVRLHSSVAHFFRGATSPPAAVAASGFASPTNVLAPASASNTASTPVPGTFTPDSSGLSPFANASVTAANLDLTNPAGSSISTTTLTTNVPSETGPVALSLVFGADVPEPTSIVLGAFALPLLVFLRRRRAAA